MNMPMKSASKFAGFAIAACVICVSTSASAGFQWTPPAAPFQIEDSQTSAAQQPTIVEGKPGAAAASVAVATESPEIVSPVVIEGAPAATTTFASPAGGVATTSPAPITPPAPVLTPAAPASADMTPTLPIPDVKISDETSPEQIAVAPTPAAPSAKLANSSVVRGFANHVPLTVALRQLLPPAYSFSVDEDVDMGVMVSFKGGKPWRDTLVSALQPVGLVARDQGQMIVISRTDKTAAAPVAPAAAPVVASPEPAAAETNPVVFDNVPPPAAAPPLTAAYVPAAAPPPAPPAAPAPVENGDSSTLITSVAGEAVKVTEMWTADRGDSLHKVLISWCRRAHVELEWLAEYDYPLQASVNLTGTFEEAVRNLLIGFEDAQPQPVAQLHANTGAGQKVLVVRTRGNTNKD